MSKGRKRTQSYLNIVLYILTGIGILLTIYSAFTIYKNINTKETLISSTIPSITNTPVPIVLQALTVNEFQQFLKENSNCSWSSYNEKSIDDIEYGQLKGINFVETNFYCMPSYDLMLSKGWKQASGGGVTMLSDSFGFLIHTSKGDQLLQFRMSNCNHKLSYTMDPCYANEAWISEVF